MVAGNAEECSDVAEQLAVAIEATRDIDLNLLLDDEVRTVLDAREDLLELCHSYRQEQQRLNQHTDAEASE